MGNHFFSSFNQNGNLTSLPVSTEYCPITTGELIYEPNVDTLAVRMRWLDPAKEVQYLEYAEKNGITEIYLAEPSPNRHTADFIGRASEKGIKVFWLRGDMTLDNTVIRNGYINNYLPFQASQPEHKRFAGVHLDVEPWSQPNPTSSETRQKMIDFLVSLRDEFPDEHFDRDLDVGMGGTVTYRGQPDVPLYQAFIQEADRVIMMSYTDTAKKIINMSLVPAYIAYARSLNKQIFLAVDSNNNLGSSFKDRGKSAMYYELNQLKGLANYNKLGLAIHHMSEWYNLPDYGVDCEPGSSA